ncbi:MAG: DUF5675 family protein [Bacteroidota bacterium]|nr:DUF5675 family protein [Bacteroidota bacterium]
MELQLVRTYHPLGTNGSLFNGEQFICSTIELPWKGNKSRVSCIPEGRYELVKRYSARFKWHLWVKETPGRFFILIHPFNDAVKESKGCIACVTKHTGPGKGSQATASCEKLKALVYPVLERNEKVFITIKSV